MTREIRIMKKDGVTEAEGQGTKATSIPVVLPSDQLKQRTTNELDVFVSPFIDVDSTLTYDGTGKLTQIVMTDGVKTATFALGYDAVTGRLTSIAKTIT